MTNHNHQETPDIPSHHYRAFVGPYEKYDLMAAAQFHLLTSLGLRDHHKVLDIGCGSLRAGRLLIPYLQAEGYYGIEPEAWLIQEGIDRELGQSILDIKKPSFSQDTNFALTTFGTQFDFIMAQSIFSHTSQVQIEQCLAEARKVMKETSLFVATIVIGEESYTGDSWVYPGIVTYRREDMISWSNKYDLACEILEWHHPNNQTWVLIYDAANTSYVQDWKRQHSVEKLQVQVTDLNKQLDNAREQLQRAQRNYEKLHRSWYVQFGLKVRSLLRRTK